MNRIGELYLSEPPIALQLRATVRGQFEAVEGGSAEGFTTNSPGGQAGKIRKNEQQSQKRDTLIKLCKNLSACYGNDPFTTIRFYWTLTGFGFAFGGSGS